MVAHLTRFGLALLHLVWIVTLPMRTAVEQSSAVAAAPASAAATSAGPFQARRVPVAPIDKLISQPAVIAAMLVSDLLTTVTAGLATHLHWYEGGQPELALSLAIASILTVTIAKWRWAYTIANLTSWTNQIAETGRALFIALSALVVVHVIAGVDVTPLRGWAFEWFLVAWALAIAGRAVMAGFISNWANNGRLARRAVIVGGGPQTKELIERLDKTGSTAVQILGIFDDRDKNRAPEKIGHYDKLGRFEDLGPYCREHRVDLLIVALPTTAEERIMHVLKKLWELPIDVRVAAIGSKLKLRDRAYAYIGDVPFLPVFDKPMSDWSFALKLVQDRVLAAIGLMLLAPLFGIIALAVKLESRGPVFFRQQRYGFNNETIGVYKFRSMYVDQCDADASRLVTKGDPRVTRVGAFLRKTSLDELPQFLNVLKGELSLVGPRPHAKQAKADGRIYDQVVDGYFARHKVKPGITGWAQVHGWRGETDTQEKIEQRVAHDLYYIEHWSTWLDLRILVMTPLALFKTQNAY